MPLRHFDPLVAEWFLPLRPRHRAADARLAAIRAGRDVLISAPTGSGKTLAAFLICLDGLVRAARTARCPTKPRWSTSRRSRRSATTSTRTSKSPLAEIAALAGERGIALAPIRAALRTGDTPQCGAPAHDARAAPHPGHHARVALHPAHRRQSRARCWRSVAHRDRGRDPRRGRRQARLAPGAHAGAARPPGRAARRPAARSASASPPPSSRSRRWRRSSSDRRAASSTSATGARWTWRSRCRATSSAPVATNEMWGEIYDRLAALIREHRTTLVFVNTRRLAERVAHHLAERLGEDAVLPHHGSLSRALRLDAEQRLKNGELRAVVATASLELGIDIGTVDLVVPDRLAALHRGGAAAHRPLRPLGGRAAQGPPLRHHARRAARVRRAGARHPPRRAGPPRDPAQRARYPGAADRGRLRLRRLRRRRAVRSGAPRLALPRRCARARFRRRAGHALRRHRHRARPQRRLPASRRASTAACAAGAARGSPPSPPAAPSPTPRSTRWWPSPRARRWARWTRISPSRAWPATSSCWAPRPGASAASRPAACAWRTRTARAPGIPFWRGEAPGRTRELSREVSRAARGDRRTAAARRVAASDASAASIARGAEQAVAYVQRRHAPRSAPCLPPSRVVAERFFDEAGGMQLVLHAPFGARINRAWGLALRKRFCRTFNFELQAAATDNGIVISLGEQHSFPLDIVFEFLRPETVEDVLTQALLPRPCSPRAGAGTPRARWPFRATPAGARCRRRSSACAPTTCWPPSSPTRPPAPRTSTGDDPHPRPSAGQRDHRQLPARGHGSRRPARACSTGIRRRRASRPWPSTRPSLRRSRTRFSTPTRTPSSTTRRSKSAAPAPCRCAARCRADHAEGAGALDPAAIAQVAAEAWPPMRDADELHDALLRLGVLPAGRGRSARAVRSRWTPRAAPPR